MVTPNRLTHHKFTKIITLSDGIPTEPGIPGQLSYDTSSGNIYYYNGVTSSWQLLSGGGGSVSPGGPNLSLQYNDSGSFNGGELYYDPVNKRLGVDTPTPEAKIDVRGGDIYVISPDGNPRVVIGDGTSTSEYGTIEWDSLNDYIKIDVGSPNGIKIKGNTVSIGNIYPSQPLIVGSSTDEIFRVSSDNKVVITRNIVAKYIYEGSGNTHYIPLPGGLYYPIAEYFGGSFTNIIKVSVNGSGVPFRELTASEGDGVNTPGNYSFGGFAHAVYREDDVINNGDVVEVTMKVRILLDQVQGIRAINVYNNYHGSSGREYGYIDGISSVSGREPTTKIFWSYPKDNGLYIIVNRLLWNLRGAATKFVGHGKRFIPYKAYNSDTNYASGLSINNLGIDRGKRYRAVKLSLLDRTTGAISPLSSETIILRPNWGFESATGSDASLVVR